MKKGLIFAVVFVLIISLFTIVFFASKIIKNNSFSANAVNNNNNNNNTKEFAGKKIIYIDSYHLGYEWSDGIEKGIKEGLKDSGVELKIHKMDTKRNPGEEVGKKAAEQAKTEIEKFNPNIIITSDDAAFKYLIKEYYKDSDIPVVFCGLNWDSSIYGAPYKNTAGMIEISLVPQTLEYLRNYAKGTRIGYLGVDDLTAKKEAEYMEKIFKMNLTERYVKDLKEWQEEFIKMQDEVDILIIDNNAGIKDWNETKAKTFAEENTKIPSGVIYDWMTPYSLIGITKSPEEQGEWSAQAALRILGGENPSDIGEVTNKKGNLIINLKIADRLKIVFPPSVLKNAKTINS